MTMSLSCTVPKSPCMASAACIKIAGVPVEFKVATILVAMMALLPMPEITTLPLEFKILLTVRVKSPSNRCAKLPMAALSVSIVFLAILIMVSELFKVYLKLRIVILKECLIFKFTKLHKLNFIKQLSFKRC